MYLNHKVLVFNPPPMYFYTDPVEGFFNFFIVESSVTSPVYLPNWLSEIIQFLGNQQINIIALSRSSRMAL